MKKIYESGKGVCHIPKKLLLVMKLTAFLFVVFTLQVTATVYSQNKKLSLNMQENTIKEVLQQIEAQSEYRFIYENEKVNLDTKVSIRVTDEVVEKILKQLFEKDGINYSITDNNLILINPSDKQLKNLGQGFVNSQQQKSVSGKVTDSSGGTLPGVSVVVKGTTTGSITDANGNYSLANVPANATLQFSFVGMKTLEVAVSGKSTINVSMLEESIGIEEVVAVGYGVQKKVNLTGSISSVSTKELESRPITQASQALAGLATGVSVSQGSGRPGADGATIRIRGIGTFSGAGNDPLVLIDGLAASINDIDPNNIKSMSILKDAASAAIYGTRAANGVILIETKRGQKGKLQVSYNNYVGWQKITALPQFVDSWEYATLKGGYTPEQIAKYKDGSDPDNYPNVPHLKNLLSTGSGFQTNHNLNFMGGDDKNSFLFSLGYLNQDYIVAKDNYEQYNFGLNFDSKIKENLRLKVDLKGYSRNKNEPRSTGDEGAMIGYAVREPNTYAGKKSDGTYGYQDDFAPEAWMDSKSFGNNKSKNFLGGVELSWELIKGLTLSGKAGYNYSNFTNQWYQSTFVFNATKTYGPNKLEITSGDNSLVTLQSLLQYTKTIEKHDFSVLAGFSQESYRFDQTTASRDNFPNNELYELNAGSGSNMQNSGWGTEWALRSYFGRLNYSFDGKYLFEANARYDGTSRFPASGRWGLFPSVSLGWRVSEESFIKNNFTWIDNLKLRASWGKLGNQNISNYPYQFVLGTGWNYTFGGNLASGIKLDKLPNTDVRWETTAVTDIGLDLTVLKGQLSLTFDYFDKTTSDILYPKSVSSVLGLGTAEYNAGEVNNKGFEVMLNYHTSIGKLNIGVSPNFSYVKNKVVKLGDGLTRDIGQNLFVGESIGAIYGYEADGLFVDAADVTSYAKQPYSAEPGTIRYKDISGPEGKPDGVVNSTYDRKVLGSTNPKFAYGATITADYKGFDFSVLFQGLAGLDKQMGSYMAFAFYNGGNIQRWQADGAWTKANPDRNAVYPRLTGGVNMSEFPTSTFWKRNASFLRLKNVQVGYTIPKNIIQKIKLNNLRIFYSGQNLFTYNHFYKGWDPEMRQDTGDAPNFGPITAIHTFGVNVKF